MRLKILLYIFLCVVTITDGYAQDSCHAEYGLPVKKIWLTDGVEMAYIDKGKGKVIVFIHGLGGNISHWTKSITALSEYYRCIAIDLPGYGYSTNEIKNDSDRLGYYADAVFQFLKKLSLHKVTVAGHSMGGQIAIIAALQHPEIIQKLILADPAGLETFNESESSLLAKYSTPEFFKSQDEAIIRKNYNNNFYEKAEDVEKLIQYRVRMIKCPGLIEYSKTLSRGVKGMLSHPVKNELKNLNQKVLVVFGGNDNLIPNKLLHPNLTLDDVSRVATDNIKNVTVEIVPRAGHMLPFEKPTELNNAIRKFLK